MATQEQVRMIEVGKPAPDFTLADHNGAPVHLGDLAGRWVVLYFYPRDDTPGCTTQACEFTASMADFAGLDATVLGCSPDSPESHRQFIAKHGLGFGLLSDPDHAVMERYGAYGEKTLYGRKSIVVIRSTVLIDPEGRVAHHWRRARAKGNAAAVGKRLRELQ